MKKGIIVGVLAVFSATLPSCNDRDPVASSSPSESVSVEIDPGIRPSDWTLDYWLGDVVEYKDLDERNIYYRGKYFICYIDSAYSCNIGPDGTVDFEKNRADYHLCFQDESLVVGSIFFNDPDVEIYGLSMRSSKEEVNDFFLGMNFEYDNSFSGLDPCYRKDRVDFRVYHDYVSIDDFRV